MASFRDQMQDRRTKRRPSGASSGTTSGLPSGGGTSSGGVVPLPSGNPSGFPTKGSDKVPVDPYHMSPLDFMFFENEHQTDLGNLGSASRETRRNFYGEQVNRLFGAGAAEAQRLGGVEESRGQRVEDMIARQMQEANKPTLTREDIDREFADSADEAGRSYLSGMDNVRSTLGNAGAVGGGLAAGLAAGIEGQRQGAIVDARRDLFIRKTETDARDRARNFQNTLVQGNQMQRDPSMVWMDFLGQATNTRMQQGGQELAYSAAKDGSKAAETAGWVNAGAGGASGLAGLFL